MNKQTALDWYWDKIKSHFEHDGDLLETATFTFAIAKQKELENILGFVKWLAQDWMSIWVVDKWMWANVNSLKPKNYQHHDMYYTEEELYKIYLYKIYLQDENHS